MNQKPNIKTGVNYITRTTNCTLCSGFGIHDNDTSFKDLSSKFLIKPARKSLNILSTYTDVFTYSLGRYNRKSYLGTLLTLH